MASILLIDDDSNLLQMVKLMLERVGHQVTTSTEGERGIQMAATNKPELAIIDVMMPGLSGYDVVRRMREDRATAQIPIIILTARSQPMDKQMALEAGANAFLSKPITSYELTSRVEAVLKAGVNYRVHTGLITEPMRQQVVRSTIGEESTAQSVPPSVARTSTPAIRPLTPPVQMRPITPSAPPAVAHPPSTADMLPLPIGDLPIIAVVSLRGGAGNSTVAVNLAFLMASRGRRLCLADFSTSSGHLALQLHLSATSSHWGQLLKAGDNPSAQVVTGLLLKHPRMDVSVLAAPPLPSPQTLSTTAATNLLRELSTAFQHVVADVPHLDAATVGVLKAAHAVIVVMTDDPPSVQTTGQFLVSLQKLGVDMARVRLVLNHVRPTNDVPAETIQKALKRPLSAELPYDVEQINAIRRGTPLVVAHPDGAFAREMLRLARTLAMSQ